MKKLITFSMIIAVVALMSNCSPKVAKTASKTEKSETKENTTKENPNFSGSTTTGSSNDVVKAAQGDRTNEEQIKLLVQSNETRLETGKKLYETTCNKCHSLYSPDAYNANAWVEIMKDMGPKSKIDQSTYLMISAYLVKRAKA